jgi:hypothetical protein
MRPLSHKASVGECMLYSYRGGGKRREAIGTRIYSGTFIHSFVPLHSLILPIEDELIELRNRFSRPGPGARAAPLYQGI